MQVLETRALLKTFIEMEVARSLLRLSNRNETRKPQFYRAVEDLSKECPPVESRQFADPGDAQIAEATYDAGDENRLGSRKAKCPE